MPFSTPRIDILTKSEPRLDAPTIIRRFASSIKPILPGLGLAPDLRFKQAGGTLRLALGSHRFSLRTATYYDWAQECDDWEYGCRAAWMEHDGDPGTEGFEETFATNKGAIIVEAESADDAKRCVVLLAHLAAAAMDDAAVVVAPPSGAMHPVDDKLRDGLRHAATYCDVLATVLRRRIERARANTPIGHAAIPCDEFWYIVHGLHVFGLPDVGTKLQINENNEMEQLREAEAAVQSFVMYMLERGQAVPIGHTTAAGNGPTYCIAQGTFEPYRHATCGQIDLVPLAMPLE